jgi:hypothetical protein
MRFVVCVALLTPLLHLDLFTICSVCLSVSVHWSAGLPAFLLSQRRHYSTLPVAHNFVDTHTHTHTHTFMIRKRTRFTRYTASELSSRPLMSCRGMCAMRVRRSAPTSNGMASATTSTSKTSSAFLRTLLCPRRHEMASYWATLDRVTSAKSTVTPEWRAH